MKAPHPPPPQHPLSLPHDSHCRIRLHLSRQSQLATLADGVFRVQFEQELWCDVSADALVHHQMTRATHGAVGVSSRGGVAPWVVERGVAHLEGVEVTLVPEHVVVCSQRKGRRMKNVASCRLLTRNTEISVTLFRDALLWISWFGKVMSERQAICVQSSADASSRNRCCSGTAISITYYKCVSVACYPLRNAHAPYCHLYPVRLYHILAHYLLNGTIFLKMLSNMKCVFWLSLQLLFEIFLILRIIRRDIIRNVHRSSCKVPFIFDIVSTVHHLAICV